MRHRADREITPLKTILPWLLQATVITSFNLLHCRANHLARNDTSNTKVANGPTPIALITEITTAW